MPSENKDAIGQAILEYHATGVNHDIVVKSEICDDDVIPSEYLFRAFDELPEIEKLAITECKGKVLDVGAAAGSHAKELIKRNHEVYCIDTSPGAIDYLRSQNIPSEKVDFFNFSGSNGFDTILLLMNGIGIAGTLSHLEFTLLQLKSHLNPGGQVVFDSSDIKYLYEDDEGGLWVDLNTEYYGNFEFRMQYKNHETDWFKWLYVDFDKLNEIAQKAGFTVQKLYNKDNHYLVKLTVQ